MTIQYGVRALILNDGKTYYFVTLDGDIPSSATRYKTLSAAQKAAQLRQVRYGNV